MGQRGSDRAEVDLVLGSWVCLKKLFPSAGAL